MESDSSSCSKILSNDGKHLIFQLEAFSPDRQAIFHAFEWTVPHLLAYLVLL